MLVLKAWKLPKKVILPLLSVIFFSLGGSTPVEFLTFSFFKWHFLEKNSNGAKSHQKLRSVLNVNIIPTNSKIYKRSAWTFYPSKKSTIVYNLPAIGQKSDEVTVAVYYMQLSWNFQRWSPQCMQLSFSFDRYYRFSILSLVMFQKI